MNATLDNGISAAAHCVTDDAAADPAVVQCVREIGPGGGVSGVAFALESAWIRSGLKVRSFTLADLGLHTASRKPVSLWRKKAKLLIDVLSYSIFGSIRARVEFDRHQVVCHNDSLFGSVYVNHGLHRAMLETSGRKWRMLLRNPLHAFVFGREILRFKLDVHDRYVCFSESERRLLLSYYPRIEAKVRVIPNGVDLKRFRPDDSVRQPLRARHAIPAAAFVMAFVGHEFERKGLYTVLECLPFTDPNVHLVVVGGSQTEIEKARQQAGRAGTAARVHFLGVVSNVEEVLNASDCLVMPSLFEAWPLVGLEAMACGVPVLMTPVGGVPEFLFDGVNGYRIEREARDIAAKLALLQSDPQALQKMRARCVHVAAGYSWDVIARQYLSLLAECRLEASLPGSAGTAS